MHAINFDDYSQANRALESMMEDDAMKDSRITLYSREFGQRVASHIIVEDFDSYADYASSTEKRLASHGWTRYQLESMGSEYLGSDQIMVVGNPGVLRLVAMRTGSMAYTHAVLIGGPDFESVQKYLDKLFASDAFAEFAKKVGDTRKVVGVNTYSRVATYGD